jgi:hypothetical protein
MERERVERHRTYQLTQKVWAYAKSVSDDPKQCEAFVDWAKDCRDLLGNSPFDLGNNAEVPADLLYYWLDVIEGKSPYYDPKTGKRRKPK